MRTGRTVRAAAIASLTSLTAVFGVGSASPAAAHPVPDDQAVSAAAAWLTSQFVGGDHIETSFDGFTFPDYGLTADAVLAFGAADLAQDHAAAATDWLASEDVISEYVGDGDTVSWAGALAKLSLVAIAQGADPSAFGGRDLIGELEDRKGAIEPGRFSDLYEFDSVPADYSNSIGQSLAIIALLRDDPEAEVADAVRFLLGVQCADGGFPLNFPVKAAPAESSESSEPASSESAADSLPAVEPECLPDPDSTSFAIQALLAAGSTEAADEALDHLEDVQRDNGGFEGSGPTAGVVNANSTGLAAQALRVGERGGAADAAVTFLRELQLGCDAPAEQRGAVAYDATGFETATATRATAQALYGLSGTGLFEVANTGDAATAQALDCSVAPPAGEQPPPQGSAGPGDLAATGVEPVPATVVGVLLVLAGTAAVVFSRRRRSA